VKYRLKLFANDVEQTGLVDYLRVGSLIVAPTIVLRPAWREHRTPAHFTDYVAFRCSVGVYCFFITAAAADPAERRVLRRVCDSDAALMRTGARPPLSRERSGCQGSDC
jgi:hypothetical protein